jgi:hypothetical protein
MRPASSNSIHPWSKRFCVVLLTAMAIVSAGSAQQISAGEKGNVKGQILC